MTGSIIVAGSSGFVGRHLEARLRIDGENVFCLKRTKNLADTFSTIEAISTVFHLAGLAHIFEEPKVSSYDSFLEANCEYALKVARLASKCGMKRFVYVSSIGVYGKSSSVPPIREESELAPKDDYGRSKVEAEKCLIALSEEMGFELVVVRPALVYGFDAPGNIHRLLALIEKLPLIPIAEKRNRRAFLYVENLVDFLLVAANHPRAVGQTFNVAEDPISTHELLSGFARGMKKKPILLVGSRFLWKLIFRITGKKKMYEQLFENLVIDMSFAQKKLGWKPKFETRTALEKTGQMFIKGKYS